MMINAALYSWLFALPQSSFASAYKHSDLSMVCKTHIFHGFPRLTPSTTSTNDFNAALYLKSLHRPLILRLSDYPKVNIDASSLLRPYRLHRNLAPAGWADDPSWGFDRWLHYHIKPATGEPHFQKMRSQTISDHVYDSS